MSVLLLFSGQGAQVVGMGRSLHEGSAVARELYAEANDLLGWDLREVSFAGPEAALTETRHCQPALFVHGYVLHRLLQEKGRLESGVAAAFGLSLGEITALAVAGVFDFATGLRVVAERGRLMQEACAAAGGGMAALIGGTREGARNLAAECGLDVANYNCPGQVVLSGPLEGIRRAVAEARLHGFKVAKELNVAGAYHSRLMESARSRFADFLRDVPLQAPTLPVYTNTTGGRISDPEAIRAALPRQVVSPVYFEDNLRQAVADTGVTRFLECGPGGVLAGFARRIDRAWDVQTVNEFQDI